MPSKRYARPMQQELQTLETEVTASLAGLSSAQTQATPLAYPEKWSIQQIIEHLLNTYRVTLPVLQTRIDKRSPTRAVPTLPQRIGQFTILNLGQFPHGRKSPPEVSPSLPATLRTGAELSSRVHAELVKVDALATEGEILFGTKRAASHMILGPLSMRQWRRFHLLHGRHHLKQIAAIRRERSI